MVGEIPAQRKTYQPGGRETRPEEDTPEIERPGQREGDKANQQTSHITHSPLLTGVISDNTLHNTNTHTLIVMLSLLPALSHLLSLSLSLSPLSPSAFCLPADSVRSQGGGENEGEG